MAKEPLVSIVIPYFNRKQFVKIMIDSVINQIYTNWELIMVDDGSTDGTQSLLIEYTKKEKRILSYVREDISQCKGACTCRNIGLHAATGEYIIFFDSDDWITPNCLADRVAFMEQNREFDFSVSPFFTYRNKDVYNGYSISGVDVNQNDLSNLFIRNLPFTVVNNIYRRSSLINANIVWDEQLQSLQDADFNISCLVAGLKYAYCNQDKFDYYVRMIGNTSSISKTVTNESQFNSHVWFLRKNIMRGKKTRAVELMVESIYILINSVGYNEEYSKQIREVIPYKRYIFLLAVKDFICRVLHVKLHIPL